MFPLCSHSWYCERAGTNKVRVSNSVPCLYRVWSDLFVRWQRKNTGWATWKVFEEITPAFVALSSMPTEDRLKNMMPEIERFVTLMYDRMNTCTTVNEARKDLFTRKGRSIENIPPTYGALLEHTKWVAYQASYCWGQTLTPNPTLPSPAEWGWTKSANLDMWRHRETSYYVTKIMIRAVYFINQLFQYFEHYHLHFHRNLLM